MTEAAEDTRFELRMSRDLRRKIRQAAGKADLSLAEWIRRRVEEAADRELSEG